MRILAKCKFIALWHECETPGFKKPVQSVVKNLSS